MERELPSLHCLKVRYLYDLDNALDELYDLDNVPDELYDLDNVRDELYDLNNVPVWKY